MESSREQDQVHQEVPRETQEQLTDEELRRRAEELDKFRENPVFYRLRRMADLLDYDDECGGEAVRAYREQLQELAKWVNSFKEYGFTAHFRGSEGKGGYVLVELTRPENPDEKFALYYEGFKAFPDGFPRNYHEQVMDQMRKRASTALEVARMFGAGGRESPGA